jgi:glycosyltransferase involved in cell wall biosynthesis
LYRTRRGGTFTGTMPVRVLRIIARMNVGGPAIHAALLTNRLDPARYDSLLATGALAAGEASYLDLFGQRVDALVEIPDLGREIHPWRDLNAYRALAEQIRRFKPDIVHTHTAKAGLLGRLAARRAGVPVVIHTFHGHVLQGYFSKPKEELFVRAERHLARSSSALIAVSTTVRDELLARGIGRPEQFHVIPLGFDLSSFLSVGAETGSLQAELGIPPGAPIVAIVARLVPIKAHDVFLEVFQKVLSKFPDAVAVIAGDGERRRELEALARAKNIFSSTRFLGWRRDLTRVYSDSRVVVLTSRNEGSPVTLIEAMACARPVVATRAGGVAELVGDAGILCNIDDADALSRGVIQVLSDPRLAADLGARGRARVARTFDQNRLVEDIDALYQRCLARVS